MWGWDGWTASPTQWAWVWANSGRWWRTGKPGMLQSMGLQRVGHDWVTKHSTAHWSSSHNKEILCSSVPSCCSVAKLCATLCNPMDCSMQASLPFTLSPSLLKFMSFELVMLSNHLILGHPLLSSIFPSIRIFFNELSLCIMWPSIGASASVLPVNIQSWFPLGLTGLISFLSKGLARVFSSTTVHCSLVK